VNRRWEGDARASKLEGRSSSQSYIPPPAMPKAIRDARRLTFYPFQQHRPLIANQETKRPGKGKKIMGTCKSKEANTGEKLQKGEVRIRGIPSALKGSNGQ